MNSPLTTFRETLANLPEWASAAFPAPGGGLQLRQPAIIRALAVAFGNSPAAWDAAVESVLTGPDKLSGPEQWEVYTQACADETARRKHFIEAPHA